MIAYAIRCAGGWIGQDDIGQHRNLAGPIRSNKRLVIAKAVNLREVAHPNGLRHPLAHRVERGILENDLRYPIRSCRRDLQCDHCPKGVAIKRKRINWVLIDPIDHRIGVVPDKITIQVRFALAVSRQI